MASDHTADKTVTPERIVAAANAAALAKERAPREHAEHSKVGATALALGALGVVYGDIGTSPLYSLKEAFTEKSHRLAVDEINVYGVCSLAFWSLVIIISIKYLMLVMRADNKGEGGILALTALVMPKRGRTVAKAGILVSLGVFGTSLLYGDGIITPAISVLSAVEGLEEVSKSFERWVIPIAIVILIGLFGVQRRGTGAMGKVFGPVMMVWFATIAVLGLWHISDSPGIIKSVNPYYAIHFFGHESMKAFLSLGSIFLVVTGGEALYADMGHFGRRPIVLGWYAMVLPSLLLNYWGQGAFLIGHPEDVHSVFFRMVPESLLLPVVILATCATVIASQALISGVFSLTAQAVKLDYLPRIKILHTSQSQEGQIYVPLVNWLLMVACVGLVLGFRSSRPCGRVGHRRHDDHGHHHPDLLPRPHRSVGVADGEGVPGVRAAVHDRDGFSRCQHCEDPARRLVRPHDRRDPDGADADVAYRSSARGQAHPARGATAPGSAR